MKNTIMMLSMVMVFCSCFFTPAYGADKKDRFPDSCLTYDLYYNSSTITFSPDGIASFTAPTPFVSVDFGWLSRDAFFDIDTDAIWRFVIGSLSQATGTDKYPASDSKHSVFYARNFRARASVSAMDLGPGYLCLALNMADFNAAYAYIPTTAVHDLVMGGLGFGAGPSYLWFINSMLASHLSATYNLAFDLSTQQDNPLIPDTYVMLEADLWFLPLRFLGLHAYVGYEVHFFSKRTNPDYPSIYDGIGSILSLRLGGTLALSVD
jgi:hypothetical protein